MRNRTFYFSKKSSSLCENIHEFTSELPILCSQLKQLLM